MYYKMLEKLNKKLFYNIYKLVLGVVMYSWYKDTPKLCSMIKNYSIIKTYQNNKI